MQSEGVSFINWIARTIHLDMLDIKPQQKLGAPRGLEQYPVAHEFGHTIGNVRGAFPSIIMGFNRMSIISHGDEYGMLPPSEIVRQLIGRGESTLLILVVS